MPKATAVKVAASLVARKLMREMMSKGMPVWRESDEGRAISLLITAAGRKAIVAEEGLIASEAPEIRGGKVSHKKASKNALP